MHAGLQPPLLGGSAQSEPQNRQEKDYQQACQLGKRVLVTGASGGVGIFLVQLAARAGMHVVAASGSVARNGDFLRELGLMRLLSMRIWKVVRRVGLMLLLIRLVGRFWRDVGGL